MKRFLLKLMLTALIASTSLSAARGYTNDEDFFGVFQIMGGTSQNYADTDLFGFGMRIAFPAVGENVYLGLMADVQLFSSGESTAHLGFAMNIRIADELFLTGSYGWAAGYADNNSTSSDVTGNFYDVGLQYQLSEYIGFGVFYRDTAFSTSIGTLNEQEIHYSFNIAMTRETWMFFDLLFD